MPRIRQPQKRRLRLEGLPPPVVVASDMCICDLHTPNIDTSLPVVKALSVFFLTNFPDRIYRYVFVAASGGGISKTTRSVPRFRIQRMNERAGSGKRRIIRTQKLQTIDCEFNRMYLYFRRCKQLLSYVECLYNVASITGDFMMRQNEGMRFSLWGMTLAAGMLLAACGGGFVVRCER